MKKEFDAIVVGTGAAGCFTALNLQETKEILIITASKADESDSYLAQGGICVLRDETDYDAFFEDTMRAGHYENNPEAVDVMIRNSREVIQDLIDLGVEFASEHGDFLYTKEGGHSRPRILYYGDMTGKAITKQLIDRVHKAENITMLEHTAMVDLDIAQTGETASCKGIIARLPDLQEVTFNAKDVILATGGIGGNYEFSTNFPHMTGDSIHIAKKHGIALKDLDYVQIHPTALYDPNRGERSFLISESVRGEGAVLLNKEKQRFTDELQPRDKLTADIYAQMERDGTPHVWLRMRTIKGVNLRERFPNISQHCMSKGLDVEKDDIPVVPAQHYFMGGIAIDTEGRTSLSRLYAVGETACNGVHGRNRLASNSLLESLVFSKRAAQTINRGNKDALVFPKGQGGKGHE